MKGKNENPREAMRTAKENPRAATILIGIGLLLFVFRYALPVSLMPLATWPMLLLGIGLSVGILTRFRHPMSYALMIIGAVFLFNTDLPVFAGWYILPLVFIASGILTMFVTKPATSNSNK